MAEAAYVLPMSLVASTQQAIQIKAQQSRRQPCNVSYQSVVSVIVYIILTQLPIRIPSAKIMGRSLQKFMLVSSLEVQSEALLNTTTEPWFVRNYTVL